MREKINIEGWSQQIEQVKKEYYGFEVEHIISLVNLFYAGANVEKIIL